MSRQEGAPVEARITALASRRQKGAEVEARITALASRRQKGAPVEARITALASRRQEGAPVEARITALASRRQEGAPVEARITALASRRQKSAEVEARITALASRQHGVVTRPQLLEAGLTAEMVDGRVRSRRLRLMHRGVYLQGALVGPLEPARARAMAAVLACGPDAVLSHESAAVLWRMIPPDGTGAPVHVTIPGTDRGRRPGIRPHRVASLLKQDATVVDGLPVTTPTRTLIDIASRIRPRALEQAVADADRRGLVDLQDLAAKLERASHVRGAPVLRRLLAVGGMPAFTRSAAEERFLALVRKGGLPTPETNVRVGGHEVDFLWRSARVMAEVDGFAYHSSRRTFENDRRRDARLAALGFRIVRVTWQQLGHEPHAVLVRLAQVLALARSGA